MVNPVHVISVGYGRHLFDPLNNEHQRQVQCATAVLKLDLIVFTQKSDGLSTVESDSGLTIWPTNTKTRLSALFVAAKLAGKIIKTSDGEVIINTQDVGFAGLVGLYLKCRYGVRLIVQEHGDVYSTQYWRKERLQNQIEYMIGLLVLRYADSIRVVAKRIVHTLKSRGVTAPITLLPVAVNPEPFVAARTTRPHSSDVFMYVTVARFVPQKNLTSLIQAFAEAYNHDNRLRLSIVGRGPDETKLKQQIEKYFSDKIDGDLPVVIIPWTDDVPSLFEAADAYVLSSNYEGWARVLIEAAVAGLPIVTTDVGCVGEVILADVHALVVPVDHTKALSDCLGELASDAALYQRLQSQICTLNVATLPGVNIDQYGLKWARSLTQ